VEDFHGPGFGQQLPRFHVSPDGQLVTIEMRRLTAIGPGEWIEVTSYAVETHALVITYITQPSAITVSFDCSKDGLTVASVIGTSTDTTGDLISGAATCAYIRPRITALTGTVELNPVYSGRKTISVSASTTGSPNSNYATAFKIDLTSLTNSSGTVATATSILIGTMRCVNTSASAATILVTNTAGTYLVGGAAGFSLPANSDVTWTGAGGIPSVGVKWWSGTNGVINCTITGWQ